MAWGYAADATHKTINQLRLRRAAAAPRRLVRSGAPPVVTGTFFHVAPRPARARTCDHTRLGMGTYLFHREDLSSRAAREDALGRAAELQPASPARADTRSSEKTADTLVGVAAAAARHFYV